MLPKIEQNYHTDSVLGLEDFHGIPVLIHQGGRYPSVVADDGTRIDRYIGVTFWDSNNSFSVTGYAGYGYGGLLESITVGSAESLDAARQFFPAAVDVIKNAPNLYAQARDIGGKYGPWAGPLSRDEYVALAAELGFQPEPDRNLSIWGDFAFPSYSLDILPRLLTNQRRAYSYKREIEKAAEAATAMAATKRASNAEALPVLRTETRFVPVGWPNEFLEHGNLFTVVSRHGRRISEDDPAFHGSHLLGYEGDYGEMVVMEVRSK